jgi:hypothetical protein
VLGRVVAVLISRAAREGSNVSSGVSRSMQRQIDVASRIGRKNETAVPKDGCCG